VQLYTHVKAETLACARALEKARPKRNVSHKVDVCNTSGVMFEGINASPDKKFENFHLILCSAFRTLLSVT
jgi:hypothetical protein